MKLAWAASAFGATSEALTWPAALLSVVPPLYRWPVKPNARFPRHVYL